MSKEWTVSREQLITSLQNLKRWVDLDAPQWTRVGLKKEIDKDICSPRPYKEFESFYRQLPMGPLGSAAATICSCNRLNMDVIENIGKVKPSKYFNKALELHFL